MSLENHIARWHAVALTADPALLQPLLADDAVFESPIVHTPHRGKEKVLAYLNAAGLVFKDSEFHYVGQWTAVDSAVLEFAAVIDGIAINGIDMIRWNEAGLISYFKVMVRPLKAVNMLHQKMGEMLAAARRVV